VTKAISVLEYWRHLGKSRKWTVMSMGTGIQFILQDSGLTVATRITDEELSLAKMDVLFIRVTKAIEDLDFMTAEMDVP